MADWLNMHDGLTQGTFRSFASNVRIYLDHFKKRLSDPKASDHLAARESARDFCRFVINSGALEFLAMFEPQNATDFQQSYAVLEPEIRELLRQVSGLNVYAGRAASCGVDARLTAIEENLQLVAGLANQILTACEQGKEIRIIELDRAGGELVNEKKVAA